MIRREFLAILAAGAAGAGVSRAQESGMTKLRGVSYDWTATGKHQIGVIAEEVATVVPEVVSFEANHCDARGVDYARLTALLIEAVKEQQAQIRELKANVEKMRTELAVRGEIARK